ncbi:MAG: prepilin peptidase [Betaproteobacteria bacterium]|nr:prepilin peptidase [Betaproteobacteria bacterium]
MVGSFLNVVIHRLPRMMDREWRAQCEEFLFPDRPQAEDAAPRYNLVVPRSACPSCGRRISAIENIPVLSYLVQRGRCKGCGVRISARYPAVECLTALLSFVVAYHLGPTAATLFALGLVWALIALAFIDADTTLLPDDITLPLLWAGLLVNAFGVFTTLHAAVIGAAAGYVLLWVVFWGFKLLTGKDGMGYGDFKLLAALGAWLGWPMLPVIILLSAAAGALMGVAGIIFFGREKGAKLPFGPYLAVAGFIALLWGKSLTLWYLGSVPG